jgi:exonuclease III
MRIISWNVRSGGGNRIERIVTSLGHRCPDIVALQEIRPAKVDDFRERLQQIGLCFFADSFPRCGTSKLKAGRQNGELVASRWPVEQLASTSFGIPWSEKVLSVRVGSPWGDVEIHNVHVPNGSEHGRTKVETFEAIYRRLACNARHHRLLCGDFNSPQDEMKTGELITWGQVMRKNGQYAIPNRKWDGVSDERWDLAERSVLEGLRRYDLRDAYRMVNGYQKKAHSYVTKNRDKVTRRRFDHILASASLRVVECQYLLGLLRLSDHAPIEAVFKPSRQ